MKNLFDFIYSNSQVFYTQFGNKTSFMIIDQIYSLINILRESINSNNNSNNLEASFLNEINSYIEKMFGTIDFYKMINNPYIEFISSHFDYSKFLNYQSVNNYNKYIEKNKKILLELTNNI
jgi:DNA-binding transcriptional regulator GbsR (MarR family)